MSIIITNISEDHGIEYGKGMQRYVLKINSKELIEFEHNFNAGLSECLRAAAVAFEGDGKRRKNADLENQDV